MDTTSSHAQIPRKITGYWTSQAIYAAAKFGIADLLKDGPRSAQELTKAAETDPGVLYRLLRALASVRIFVELALREFSLTPLLRPCKAISMVRSEPSR